MSGGGTDQPAWPRARTLRRAAACVAIAAYLGTTAFYLARHALGKPSPTPLGYCFTWDMFPWHYSESCRRVALGQRRSGEYVQLVPCGLQQFRGGVHGGLTRVDLDRRGGWFRPTVEQTLRLTGAGGGSDPVTQVWLCEEYWPVKFNLPPEVYVEQTGRPRPERRYWRVLGKFDWRDGGTVPAGEVAP